jgi:hypothetical protein
VRYTGHQSRSYDGRHFDVRRDKQGATEPFLTDGLDIGDVPLSGFLNFPKLERAELALGPSVFIFSRLLPSGTFAKFLNYFVTGTRAAAAGTHLPFSFTKMRSTFASSVTLILPFASAALNTVWSLAIATFP